MPPVPASAIATRLSAIRQRLESACRRCGRAPESVQLIAVSKKQPVAAMADAVAAGQQLFGESYVQEFIDKQQQLDLPLEWHFIGALQSNKVKYLRGRTALIHSVDRWSLAQEIDRQWGRIG
ncbi:MAG: YggS family pyridoxal phosphate-dependent enzyme, partial [Desulfuromonas sp.]